MIRSRIFTLLLCNAIGCLAAATTVAAQDEVQLSGRVEDAVTMEPLPGVVVMTIDSSYSTITTAEGMFSLSVGAAQPLSLYAELPGYQLERFDLPEEARSRATILRLQPEPLQLAGVTGTVDRVRWSAPLANSGYYDRARIGIGIHLDKAAIERSHAFRPTDIFSRIAGIRRYGTATNGDPVYTIARCGTGTPPIGAAPVEGDLTFVGPDVYVDGIPWIGSLNELSVDWIEAVEVYQGASGVPAQYKRTANTCGVVLVWTGR